VGPIRRSGALARLLALLTAMALVAAACGDDDTTGDGGAATTTDGATGPGGEGPDGSGDDGGPVHGGTLVYGIEADTANAWAHYRASYAPAGYVVLRSIADPLFTLDEDRNWVPVLAESYDHNDDYTEWTFTIRDGITFHDGTPLDGEAVKLNIEACIGAPLTGPAYSNIASVTAEGQVVTLTTAQTPWVVLPNYFAGGSCSYMLSAEWLNSLPDLPHRVEGNPFYDPEIAALPADGDPAAPVGTGAFVYQSYTPGNGNAFVAERNEDYWRGPNGTTGEELPYLDRIEVVVAVDIERRANGLRSGQFDVMHTSNSDEISAFLAYDAYQTITSTSYGDTSYIMLNVAEGTANLTGVEIDPTGANAESPMTTRACRRALAHALDLERFVETREAGLPEPANGPFPPGSVGHLDDTGYPEYDLDAARAGMETCLAERGTDRIEFAFNTTNDPFNVESNQLAISMWQEAFGDQVTASITPIEQGQYIGLALTGAFQALGWRSHQGTDPDSQLLWWISATAAPIGDLALNFGRINDPVIDENLITVRTNPDPDTRREAAEAINRQFGEEVYNLWYYWTVWSVITDSHVNDVLATETLDGSTPIEMVGPGHTTAQMWCSEGVCES
jgi:peptide/nickel transport system substrate-binding protein